MAKAPRPSATLTAMVNDTVARKALIDLISTECDNLDSVKGMTGILENPMLLEFRPGQISREKLDASKMAYWIVLLRERMTRQCKLSRPKHHGLRPPKCPYSSMLQTHRHLVRRMLDSGLPLVVLRIRFLGGRYLRQVFQSKYPYLSVLPTVAYRVGTCVCSATRDLDCHGRPCCIPHKMS